MLQTTIKKIKEARVPITLNLSWSIIRDVGPKMLAEAIKEARAPLTLDLYSNEIGEVGAGFLAVAIREVRVPLILDLYANEIGDAGAGFLAEAIREAQVPLILRLGHNGIGETGAALLAIAIKEVRVPLILNLCYNDIGDVGAALFAQSLKECRAPLAIELSNNKIGEAGARLLIAAQEDNFIIDARLNPSVFLRRIGFSLSREMLERELGYPSVLSVLIQGYIGDDDLAWIEVAAIRGIKDASHENKYSSINTALLTAAYFNHNEQDTKEGNCSSSAQVAGTNEDDSGSSEDGTISSSPTSSSTDDAGVIDSEGIPNQRATVMYCLLGNAQSINHGHKQASQFDNYNGDVSYAESLLKILFPWIKDLPEDQQHKLLYSVSMQQMLELLEDTISHHKLIDDQLSSKPIEEIFTTEYQSHYCQDVFENNATEYAKACPQNSISIPIDFVELALVDGIVTDPLPKYDPDFGIPQNFLDFVN